MEKDDSVKTVNAVQKAASAPDSPPEDATRDHTVLPQGEQSSHGTNGGVIGGPAWMPVPAQLNSWINYGSLTSSLANASVGLKVTPYKDYLRLPIVINRLTGYSLGKFCLELKFTAQPTAYHYGLVCFSWRPYLNDAEPPTGSVLRMPVDNWAYSTSRKDSVILDLASPAEVVLRCPLIEPYGGVFPLSGGTPSDDLIQWSDAVGTAAFGVTWYNNTFYRVDTTPTTFSIEVQARIVEGGVVAGLSSEKFVYTSKRETPLSGVLTGVGDVLSIASSVLPGVGSVLAPATVFAKAGAKLAKAAGFGVPLTPVPRYADVGDLSGTQFHMDASDVSTVMSASCVAQRGVAQFGGEDLDEMSVAHIASRYGTVSNISVGPATATGALLTHIGVSPGFGLSLAAGCPPSVTWVAQAFRYWRGSLRYRIRVVASKFHSGRIRVVYEPSPLFGTSPYPDLSKSSFAFNEVFDIANGTVVEFTVPWMSNRVWGQMFEYPVQTLPVDADDVGSSSYRIMYNGVLRYYLEGALTSSNATTPNIYLWTEVSGGPDFKVAVPDIVNCGVTPISAKVATVGVKSEPRVLGAEITFENPELLTFGESVSSIRSVVKLMTGMGKVCAKNAVVPAADGYCCTYMNLLPVYPFLEADRLFNAEGGFLGSDAPYTDYISYFRTGYAAISGSLRYRVSAPKADCVGEVGARTLFPTGPVYALATTGFDLDAAWFSGATSPADMTATDVVGLYNVQSMWDTLRSGRSYVEKDIRKQDLTVTVPHASDLPTFPGLKTLVRSGWSRPGGLRPVTLAVFGRFGSSSHIYTDESPWRNGFYLSCGYADDVQFSYFFGPPMCQEASV